jgi:hypothetical protein
MTVVDLTEKQQTEFELVTRMVSLTCADKHGARDGLCVECAALLDYVAARIARCPYGEEKPTCRRCHIHCYRPAERQRIKEVMAHAGPRMLMRGDLAALKHLIHDRRPVPELKKKRSG